MNDETFPLRTLLKAFPGIPVDEARMMIRNSTVQSYPPGTVLCTEDLYESTFYILLDGQVQVTKKVDSSGSEVRALNTLGVGDFFGEMALIEDAPRAATVTTLTSTRLLEIRKEEFDELVGASPSLSRALMHEVVSRLRFNDAMAIEDLRLKARELAGAYQRLAEQEYARRQFLTTIAHELRTPLTAAGGFLQLLEKAARTGHEPDPAALHTAACHIEQITALVNDILFSQEMDLILPRFDWVNLNEVLHSALASVQDRQRENNVNVQVEVPSDLPAVAGDAASLQRALAAVLDNAIKFSYPGGVVEVDAGLENDCLWLEVGDHGVGIAPDIAPHIYDRFFHVDRIGDRLFRGVGLGLSIARQVIEQHNGKIEVQPRPGGGTLARIDLPISQDKTL